METVNNNAVLTKHFGHYICIQTSLAWAFYFILILYYPKAAFYIIPIMTSTIRQFLNRFSIHEQSLFEVDKTITYSRSKQSIR